MKTFGIDISRWQGNFNFAQAKKEGVEFAIVKCGGADDGKYEDSKFKLNCSESAKVGMKIGAYYFGNASTVEEAKAEANHCISIIRGHTFSYPIFYDVESSRMNVGKDALDAIITEFCTTLEKAGYWAGFYMNHDWYKNKCHGEKLANRFSLWLAYWGTSVPKTPAQMWQFGGETNLLRSNRIAGQVVDQNYSFIDFPTKIKQAGLNGFLKTSNSTPNSTNTAKTQLKIGDKVKLQSNAPIYGTSTRFFNWVYGSTLYLRELNGNRAVISTQKTGAVTGAVDVKYLTKA